MVLPMFKTGRSKCGATLRSFYKKYQSEALQFKPSLLYLHPYSETPGASDKRSEKNIESGFVQNMKIATFVALIQ